MRGLCKHSTVNTTTQHLNRRAALFCRRPMKRSRRVRSGMTLIELLLATVILTVSMGILARQNSVGVHASLRSELQTESALRCQSQLSRLLSTENYLPRIPESPFEDDPEWIWQASLSSSDWPELQHLRVEVFRRGATQEISRTCLSQLVRVRQPSRNDLSTGQMLSSGPMLSSGRIP